jgi:hypothetical protein
MNADDQFKESLLKSGLNGVDLGQCRQGIKQSLNNDLGRGNRIGYGLVCLASLLALGYFIELAFFTHIGDEMIRLSVQVISLLAIILIGTLAVMTGWSTLTGRSMGYFYPTFVFGSFVLILFYYFVTLLYFTFIAPITLEDPLHPNAMLANQVMTILFFAMMLIGILLIFRATTKANFEHQRKLLQIEYKLCTALEQLEKLQK